MVRVRLEPLLAMLVLGSAARKSYDKTHLELRPAFIRPCDLDHNAIKAVAVALEWRGRTTVVFHLNVTINRSVEKWPRGIIVVEQCDQAVSAATCSTFRTFEFHDICILMMSAAMPWAPIVASFQPKMSCPITKGEYKLANGTLAMDLLNTMSGPLRLEGPVWRSRLTAIDSRGDPHICADAAGEFFRVRNRPKSKGLKTTTSAPAAAEKR
ncbi:uncharacterized protein LOC113205310 [Frankliniella occidentalis]|uniref:Uncharacterized protein LOC113205310 n=1 Tax=Frankliniella occidentalis TaxID=133901 RepID=A0A6J1S7N0_FRAOC|nr:uncharacterized protein LOC113205310 [Frankliniella occidentalis]